MLSLFYLKLTHVHDSQNRFLFFIASFQMAGRVVVLMEYVLRL